MSESTKGESGYEDERHRRFREALERRKSRHQEMHSDGTRNQGIAEAHNDKGVRQFRRKTGRSCWADSSGRASVEVPVADALTTREICLVHKESSL